ncbi:MAG TPA: hypothetical protein VL172_03450 [Kofleriaceae bacterium]|nr:hypothetical protein [Kofleriaceae bacterium]
MTTALVPASNVAALGDGKFGFNKKILQVTMKSGEQFRLNVDKAKAATIRAHLGQPAQA